MGIPRIGGQQTAILQFQTGDVNNSRWYFAADSVAGIVSADPIVQTGDGEAKRAFSLTVQRFGNVEELSAMYFNEDVRNQQLVKLLLALRIDNKLPLDGIENKESEILC